MYFVERSDTSRVDDSREAFMTAFALHPEAIIQGQLHGRPRLLTSKLWNMATQVSIPYNNALLPTPQRVPQSLGLHAEVISNQLSTVYSLWYKDAKLCMPSLCL